MWSDMVDHTTIHRSEFKGSQARLSHVNTGNGLPVSYTFIRAFVYVCIMSSNLDRSHNVENTEVGRVNMGHLG